ncbi:MAG: ABC transporter permease [Deltaproteobacteria bacterium]|nr:ABC transporter permease [Candidatus Anaeroferrophillus wilburensis]MBN2888167.1 ABC transporter permease [Deltaproteobacteria bacterium]
MMRGFSRHRLAMAGLAILVLLVVVALLAPWLSPFDPWQIDLPGELEGPSRLHWLGQDQLGRDLVSRMIHGARVSLLVGISVVSVSLIFGTLIGAYAAYKGGLADAVLLRIMDVMLAFPGILLAIALISIMGPSLKTVMVALSVMGWVGYARLARGQVLAEKEQEYILAARSCGAGSLRIIVFHLLPNLAAPLIVEATFGVAGVILAESSLSFLGLGPQDVPTWGGTLHEGVRYLLFAPHLSLFPGLAIMLTVLAFNFIGDGLRDSLDVRKQ